jgi:uncharacterized protein YndB with AHSA1/START domain
VSSTFSAIGGQGDQGMAGSSGDNRRPQIDAKTSGLHFRHASYNLHIAAECASVHLRINTLILEDELMNTNSIEREVSIEAPIERVWEALTSAESIGTWFGVGAAATIDLRVGGVMVINHGDHGTFQTLIVAVDPPRAFSYRWASAYPDELATEENSTLVEFTLWSSGDGTVLRLVESGFDALDIPADRPDASFESHSKGWTGVIAKFAEHVMGNDDQPLVSSS